MGGSANTTETDRRDVAAVGLSSDNYIVCRNGMITHRECIYILHSDVCIEYDEDDDGDADVEICGLTMTASTDSVFGDSGGPVWRNNNAHGIWQGRLLYNGSWRGLFTQAIEVREAFGADHKVYLKH